MGERWCEVPEEGSGGAVWRGEPAYVARTALHECGAAACGLGVGGEGFLRSDRKVTDGFGTTAGIRKCKQVQFDNLQITI